MKKALHKILRKQIKKQTDGDSEDDDDDNMIGGLASYTEGAYAKDTIQ